MCWQTISTKIYLGYLKKKSNGNLNVQVNIKGQIKNKKVMAMHVQLHDLGEDNDRFIYQDRSIGKKTVNEQLRCR